MWNLGESDLVRTSTIKVPHSWSFWEYRSSNQQQRWVNQATHTTTTLGQPGDPVNNNSGSTGRPTQQQQRLNNNGSTRRPTQQQQLLNNHNGSTRWFNRGEPSHHHISQNTSAMWNLGESDLVSTSTIKVPHSWSFWEYQPTKEDGEEQAITTQQEDASTWRTIQGLSKVHLATKCTPRKV